MLFSSLLNGAIAAVLAAMSPRGYAVRGPSGGKAPGAAIAGGVGTGGTTGGAGSTMLTSPSGVDLTNMRLGRNTLLGQ